MLVQTSWRVEPRPEVASTRQSWRCLAAPLHEEVDPLPFGVAQVERPIAIVGQYAHEQKIKPCRIDTDELFDGRMRTRKG